MTAVVQVGHAAVGAGNFAGNTTAGNTVFLAAVMYTTASATITSSSPATGGVTPSGSTLIQSARSALNGANGAGHDIWLMPNVAGGATSFGITVSSGALNSLFAYEVSGLGISPAVDRTASGSDISSTAVDSGATAAIQFASEFILGCGDIFNGSAAGPAGWTNVSDGGGSGWTGYQIASSGTFDWAQTASSSGAPWTAGVVTVYQPVFTGPVAPAPQCAVRRTETMPGRGSSRIIRR